MILSRPLLFLARNQSIRNHYNNNPTINSILISSLKLTNLKFQNKTTRIKIINRFQSTSSVPPPSPSTPTSNSTSSTAIIKAPIPPWAKHLPSKLKWTHPYLSLARLDKPIGTWLLFWPCGLFLSHFLHLSFN